MKKTQKTLQSENTTKKGVLHLAFELSQNKWKRNVSMGMRHPCS
jgi:hypothetical protein